MIACLQQKGFLEVALQFVKDKKTRFNLAVESGNIQIVVASAKEIDDKDHQYRLGIEALRQGNAGIVEYAYQRTKNFERLSFLYLITGNMDKLSKVLRIAEIKNDVMGQSHNALYIGDIQERIKILEEYGHFPLAYVTAVVHGITEVADRLAAELGDNLPTLPPGKKSSLLMPPPPILRNGDWPLLRVTKGIFEGGLDNVGGAVHEEEDEGVESNWSEDLDIAEVEGKNGEVVVVDDTELRGEDDDEGGWDLEDLQLPADVTMENVAGTTHTVSFVTPSPGMPVSQIWIQKYSLVGEHAAVGNFDTTMHL